MPRSTHGSLHALHWPLELASVAYRALGHVMTCDITRLMVLGEDDVRPPHVDAAFELRFLSPEEVVDFARDPANELEPLLAERMACGRDLCCAALAGNELAAYAWFALGSIEAEMHRGRTPDSGVAVSFTRRAAFVYKAFTRPEYRGRRLYAGCLAAGLAGLKERGVTQLLATAEWTNGSALAACHGLGFRDLGTIVRLACGPFSFTHMPRRARALGVRLGRHARVSPRVQGPVVESIEGDEPHLAHAAIGSEG
jgi:hypothetical protein